MASILLLKEASFEASFALLQQDNFKTSFLTKHKTKTSSSHQKKRRAQKILSSCARSLKRSANGLCHSEASGSLLLPSHKHLGGNGEQRHLFCQGAGSVTLQWVSYLWASSNLTGCILPATEAAIRQISLGSEKARNQ